ncbi:MAG: DUF2974 domain-containing protein [Oscillospiraceae bacterium]|nr:DUF2974 domain-containing protein [Oscillospiraceae bacterium]
MLKFKKRFLLSIILIFVKLFSIQINIFATEQFDSSKTDNLIQKIQQNGDDQNFIQPAIFGEVTERVLLIFSVLSYCGPIKILDDQKNENNTDDQKFYASDCLKKLEDDPGFAKYKDCNINEEELQGWELVGECKLEDFYAQFWGKDKCLVIAFRGTATQTTWQENLVYLLFSIIVPHRQAKLAEGCAWTLYNQPKINEKYDIFLFTGHSLGGLLATYASVKFARLMNEFADKISDYDEEVAENFRKKIGLFTFNSLGCSQNLKNKVKKRFLGINALNFRIENDKASKIGYHFGHIYSFNLENKNNTIGKKAIDIFMGTHELFYFFLIKRFMLPESKTKNPIEPNDLQSSTKDDQKGKI